ncbi:MAG: DUF47 family protein [Betaproteobacteria bacterium]|nr:DUF47 family protein [Betaproteobacteria bacterium]
MTEKSRILSNIGESELLLPALVNRALVANDRAKYFFTLLQAAKAHADQPDTQFSDLRRERLASAIEDDTLDNVVAASAKLPDNSYSIPQATRIVADVLAEVKVMLAPLGPEPDKKTDGEFALRLTRLQDRMVEARGDVIAGGTIGRMTSGSRSRGDSLHLLVMDAHKALNRIQEKISAESIDGARVYGVDAKDRPLIQAFMRGVNTTAPLKFDHPGLGTTATRTGKRLLIQNDIGTTDAHVLVVQIEANTATVTYTDVHLQRLLFFQRMFEGFDVQWEDTRSRKDSAFEDGVYHLCLGTFEATTDARLADFLTRLGSRLVFLIDWNRARKRLRRFLPKAETLDTLSWAAEHNHGHMAFLKAGGEQLIYDALEFVVKSQLRFGEALHEVLGVKRAISYLRFVIKCCSESLLKGEHETFIQDQVRAELFNYFRSSQQSLIDIAAEHAALVVEIASGVRDSLLKARLPNAASNFRRNATRAKEWEKKADALVNRARTASKQGDALEFYCRLVEAADDIADELEEAAFHLTLLPAGPLHAPLYGTMQPLGSLLVQGAQEYLKALETARDVRRGGAREDMQDFLESVHRIVSIEHRTDEAERSVETSMVADAGDFKQLYLFCEAAKNLERAADGLMHNGLMMRDYVLQQVMSG